MARPLKGQEKGPTKPTQFRLEPETLAKLDEIAAFHQADTGVPYNRTDAVRVAIQKEHDRIRRRKGGAE